MESAHRGLRSCADPVLDAKEAIEDDRAVTALHVEEAVAGCICKSTTANDHLQCVGYDVRIGQLNIPYVIHLVGLRRVCAH
eukprot:2588793-Pyramimonas_sp.AAC.3